MTPSLNMCQVSSVQNYLQTCHPVKINLTCVICTGIPAHESTGQNYPDMCHRDKITWICVTVSLGQNYRICVNQTKLPGYVSPGQNYSYYFFFWIFVMKSRDTWGGRSPDSWLIHDHQFILKGKVLTYSPHLPYWDIRVSQTTFTCDEMNRLCLLPGSHPSKY